MSNLSYRQPRTPLSPNRLLLRTISGHESYVMSVAFFGNTYDRVITGSHDEMAKLWDLKNGRCLRKFSGHTDGVTFVTQGPDGRVLTASEDRTIRFWDVDTGECTRTIRSHSGAVTGICMAGPDRIVTGSIDKKFRVFDTSGHLCGEGELDGEIMAIASPPLPLPPSKNSRAATPSASSLSPSTVVRVLACGGANLPSPIKPMLRSVDVKTATTTGAVAFDAGTRSQSNLCTVRRHGSASDSSNDSDDEENKDPSSVEAESGLVTCVAISAASVGGAEGSRASVLVTGSYDKHVRVLRNVFPSDLSAASSSKIASGEDGDGEDVDDEEPKEQTPEPVSMRVIGRHAEGVRSVSVSADGRWAVSGGREGRVKVWEIPREGASMSATEAATVGRETSKAEADFEAHKGIVFSLCMSPDARVLVSAGSDRDVRVWDLSLVVYARRLAINRLRALWVAGRIRHARRPKRRVSNTGGGSSSGSVSPVDSRRSRVGRAGRGDTCPALEVFGSSKDERQHILESLFALPETIYAKILMSL